MKVYITKSGGYAGFEEDILNVDTSVIEDEISKDIENSIRNIHFFELPAFIPARTNGHDYYVFSILVIDKSRHHQVYITDDHSPESLHYLMFLDEILRIAENSSL
jgi:hypothetical protein